MGRRTDDADETPSRPKPEALSVDFHRDGDELVINHSGSARAVGCFLLLWLTGWTAGCIALIAAVINEPSIGTIAFAIPFWAAWLAVACILVWNFFGKEVFHLSPLGAGFSRHALVNLTHREVPLEEIRGFTSYRSKISNEDGPQYKIEMQTLGEPLRFGGDLGDSERAWLIQQLQEHLDQLTGRETRAAAPSAERALQADEGENWRAQRRRLGKSGVVVLSADDRPAGPPSDCRWQSDDEFQSIGFTKRGRFSAAAFFGLLFINAFWNGIVSVFVLALFGLMPGDGDMPQGGERWLMALFLTPFVVIGLFMLLGLLAATFAPLARITWRFERYAIVRHRGWSILRGTKTWEVDRLSCIELCPKATKRGSVRIGQIGDEDTAEFALAFVTPENTTLCSINDLTEGEARWIGGTVLRNRPAWFS